MPRSGLRALLHGATDKPIGDGLHHSFCLYAIKRPAKKLLLMSDFISAWLTGKAMLSALHKGFVATNSPMPNTPLKTARVTNQAGP